MARKRIRDDQFEFDTSMRDNLHEVRTGPQPQGEDGRFIEFMDGVVSDDEPWEDDVPYGHNTVSRHHRAAVDFFLDNCASDDVTRADEIAAAQANEERYLFEGWRDEGIQISEALAAPRDHVATADETNECDLEDDDIEYDHRGGLSDDDFDDDDDWSIFPGWDDEPEQWDDGDVSSPPVHPKHDNWNSRRVNREGPRGSGQSRCPKPNRLKGAPSIRRLAAAI